MHMIPAFRSVQTTDAAPAGSNLRRLNRGLRIRFQAENARLRHPGADRRLPCRRPATGYRGGFNCVSEVFSAISEYRVGGVSVGSKPAYGVDIDEKIAANQPDFCRETAWTQCRTPDRALHAR